ncbi:ankyrin repeat domain-containing protein [Psychrobacter celer]|uniref:ankyrin repeat domain-containing protein n=1 Tax=Psychrobacter celer TaxID=306572 RepID=UPI003FCFE47A
MKNILFLLLTILIIGCSNMNTHKNYREAHIENYFQGDNVAMAEAIFNEDTDEITRLVKQESYDVNTRDSVERGVWTYQWTYLNYAVTKGKRKSVKTLLDLGADIDKLLLIGEGHSNLNVAAGHCDKVMIKLLLDHNIQMDHTIAPSPLRDLMVNDCYSEELFDLLLEHGTDVNHPFYISGTTPVMTAYDINNHDAIDYLLSKGADPLQVSTSGHSFASLMKMDLEDNINAQTAQKYKQRMIQDYGIQYPVEVSYRKGIEQSIKRYEKATAKEKKFLGASEVERVNDMKESLITGIHNGIAID